MIELVVAKLILKSEILTLSVETLKIVLVSLTANPLPIILIDLVTFKVKELSQSTCELKLRISPKLAELVIQFCRADKVSKSNIDWGCRHSRHCNKK